MADFFNTVDRPDLKVVMLARIADPATVAQGEAVYLEADPTGGSWLPAPAYIKAKTGVTLDSKLVYQIPYTVAP